MRVPAALFVLAIAAPVSGATMPESHAPAASSASHCPRSISQPAASGGHDRARPLMPGKLAELPPATAYMAVYRQVAGFAAPLTMAHYRNPRRR